MPSATSAPRYGDSGSDRRLEGKHDRGQRSRGRVPDGSTAAGRGTIGVSVSNLPSGDWRFLERVASWDQHQRMRKRRKRDRELILVSLHIV